jgi:hypothetical protein
MILNFSRERMFSDEISRFFRLGKFARISKLIRLLRLIKLIKVMKHKDKISLLARRHLRISAATERLVIVATIFFGCSHLFACFWIIINEQELSPERWSFPLEVAKASPSSIYFAALYFIITSMTTVGYGDASAHTATERVFCIGLMIIGVVLFTFLSGAIASVITSFDDVNSVTQNKVHYLNKIFTQYDLGQSLY